MPPLRDKTALVIGGGSGIGRAIGEAFSAEGCRVVLAGRRELEVPAPLLYRRCNAAVREEVASLLAWMEHTVGAPAILVYSAGVNVPKRSLAELSPEDFDRIMAANTTGLFNCLHAVLAGMRARRDGLVLNICSEASLRAFPVSGAAYCASKFAQHALGSFAGAEAAADGVRVTNIYPGDVNTPLLDRRPVPPLRSAVLPCFSRPTSPPWPLPSPASLRTPLSRS